MNEMRKLNTGSYEKRTTEDFNRMFSLAFSTEHGSNKGKRNDIILIDLSLSGEQLLTETLN